MNMNLSQIKISIKNSEPLIWKRLLIDSGILLPELHKIFLEKILPMENNSNYPVCLEGKMNCPP